MSDFTVLSCDGCGSLAPDDHVRLIPAAGWYTVKVGNGGWLDACSADCLAVIAGMFGAAAPGGSDRLPGPDGGRPVDLAVERARRRRARV